jgi:Protein of unknown function (DUF992)
MSKHRPMLLAVAVFCGIAVPAVAQQTNQTKAGVLSCRTSASVGLIVGSHQKLSCRFTPDAGGPPENYVGHINRLGLDVGIRGGGAMAWAVLAPTSGVHHGALAGKYVGASGGASLGVGASANVLVGGSHRSFALQPLSVEGQVGVNLALGVAGLTLHSVP